MTLDEAVYALMEATGATTDDLPYASWEEALRRSLTWDAAGLVPGAAGYVDTYDLNWAAADVCDQLAIRGAQVPREAVTKVSSEGTTLDIARAGVDWSAVARMWRARSPLQALRGSLGVLEVSSPAPYLPASSVVGPWGESW